MPEKTRDLAVIEPKLREYFAADPGPAYLAKEMAPVSTWADLYGIVPGHVLVGEFGALRSDARYTASKAPDRAAYIRDVRRAAEKAGFGWSFWNLFDGLGLMDEAPPHRPRSRRGPRAAGAGCAALRDRDGRCSIGTDVARIGTSIHVGPRALPVRRRRPERPDAA